MALNATSPVHSQSVGPSVIVVALICCASSVVIAALHPRLGIRDVDGYAYAIGARSIRAGNGYRSLAGEAFNHWPPGYSLLLSVFPDAILTATVVNYVSFGAAVGLLYLLLRRSGWTWQAAGGFTASLASGFFRLLANTVHADILTYALFLIAYYAVSQRGSRLLSSLVWALLIPIKFIAAVFLPASILTDRIAARYDFKTILRSYGGGVIAVLVAITSMLIFNRLTIHAWIPSTHEHASLKMIVDGARHFAFSIPREFLFGWHSSVAAQFPRIAFPACMTLAAICLLSLRPAREGRWFTAYGLACLTCSALLLCIRWYDPSVRLTGYGLIVLLFGFRPKAWANAVWLLYGLASMVAATVNATTVNQLGINDPRYAALALQVRPYCGSLTVVDTNSFHILDIHAGVPSVPISRYSEARHDTFLWVTLANYDPGSNPIGDIGYPGVEWTERERFDGGILFSKVEALKRPLVVPAYSKHDP